MTRIFQRSDDQQSNQRPGRLARARGCLMGQVAGDSLGSLVEFMTAEQIAAAYPDGVRDLQHGGRWELLPGQPTDDSEMALALARSLVRIGRFDLADIRESYVRWLDSGPFDVGNTTRQGLTGTANERSQANGALMRVSPLGIFGAGASEESLAARAALDARLTHPNPVCVCANQLYVLAIAKAIRENPSPQQVYEYVLHWSEQLDCDPLIIDVVRKAADAPPGDYFAHQGWVVIALQNALWQLLHSPSLEDALIDTVARGGDTDTNAAICGALLGAVYGLDAIPKRWQRAVLSCRPSRDNPECTHPRPEEYWPVDILDLAEKLLRGETRST